jgi:hypothetical protein
MAQFDMLLQFSNYSSDVTKICAIITAQLEHKFSKWLHFGIIIHPWIELDVLTFSMLYVCSASCQCSRIALLHKCAAISWTAYSGLPLVTVTTR